MTFIQGGLNTMKSEGLIISWYWWVPLGTGGYWWPLVESKYYIVTNLDCYKLTDFQFTENSWPITANWEGVL